MHWGVNCRNKKRFGFTLIELLVVISILSLLSSIVISSVQTTRMKGRDGLRISQMRQMQTALEMYYADHGTYPATGGTHWHCSCEAPYPAGIPNSSRCRPSGFSATKWAGTLNPLVAGGYISGMPVDPVNKIEAVTVGGQSGFNHYCYEYTSGSTVSSVWTCNGVNRNSYEYVLIFTLESENSSLPTIANTGVGPRYTHCLHGALKND